MWNGWRHVVYPVREGTFYAPASGKAPSGAAPMNAPGYGGTGELDPAAPPGGNLMARTGAGGLGRGPPFASRRHRPGRQLISGQASDSERIANDWRLPKVRGASNPSKCCTALDPDAIATWHPGGVLRSRDRSSEPWPREDLSHPPGAGRDGFTRARSRTPSSRSPRQLADDDARTISRGTGEGTTPVTTAYHGYQTSMFPPPAGVRRRDAQHPRGVRAVRRRPDAGDARAEKPPALAFFVEAKKPTPISSPTTPTRACRPARRPVADEGARAPCADASIRSAPLELPPALWTAAATPSSSPRPIATATWSPG